MATATDGRKQAATSRRAYLALRELDDAWDVWMAAHGAMLDADARLSAALAKCRSVNDVQRVAEAQAA